MYEQQIDVAAEIAKIAKHAADGVAGHLGEHRRRQVERLVEHQLQDLMCRAYRCGVEDRPCPEIHLRSPSL